MPYDRKHLSAADVKKILRDVAFDSLKERITESIHEDNYWTTEWAVDSQADSCLLGLNATCRDDSVQEHYAFYYLGYFIETRSTLRRFNEMCFYNFPKELELYRSHIEDCFAIAVFILDGPRLNKKQQEPSFAPVIFRPDDWDPPGM